MASDLIDDLHRLMQRGDELRCALMLELDARAKLARSLTATIDHRRQLINRIQRMLQRQYSRAAGYLGSDAPVASRDFSPAAASATLNGSREVA